MKKTALHFICKNESHVILDMLRSVKPVTDLIVAVDTGSTDDTIRMIREFGLESGIPTYVFERPFDDFSRSRNYALQLLYNQVEALGWPADHVYGFWIDCDEVMRVPETFSREQLREDSYEVTKINEGKKFHRRVFFNLRYSWYWYGPIHENLLPDRKDYTKGIIEGMEIICKPVGASWQGDLHEKYIGHARMLEDFILHEDRSCPWIYFTAQSFNTAATYAKDKTAERHCLKMALVLYTEFLESNPADLEMQYAAIRRMGRIRLSLGVPWPEVLEDLLVGYSLDPVRGEITKYIIDRLFGWKKWEEAYIYTKFALINFYGKNPYPIRSLFVDEPFYNWEILDYHRKASKETGRMQEAQDAYLALVALARTKPEVFEPEVLKSIVGSVTDQEAKKSSSHEKTGAEFHLQK